jgi:transcriptional regulator with XRE-family HTH domain
MTPREFKVARNKLGLSQAQLAHILGTDPRTVRKWEAVGGTNARGVNPIAAQVVRWMLDGFRPPEYPNR